MTWKFQQIKPQKARGVLKPEMWTSPLWVAELKHDGDRRIGQACRETMRFTGTRESVDGTGFVEKTANLPHLIQIPKAMDGTVLDGEIVAPHAKSLPGGKSKYVTAIMGSSPEEAIRKQKEHGWLHWVVFDCLFHRGDDIQGEHLTYRQEITKQVLKTWGNPHAYFTEQITGAAKEKYFNAVITQGGEGVVLKHIRHTYGDEKLWVKVKGEWTADVVAMSFKPGKGKNTGEAGAIFFGQHMKMDLRPGGRNPVGLVKMGSARGFTDAQMRALGPKDIGRVFRIKHNGREPTGAFRHPRFDGWRDDKSPKDCVYDPNEK